MGKGKVYHKKDFVVEVKAERGVQCGIKVAEGPLLFHG